MAVQEGSRSTEAALHRSLASSRVQGEWFDPSPAVLAAVSSAVADSAAARPRAQSAPRRNAVDNLLLASQMQRDAQRNAEVREWIKRRQELLDQGVCGSGHTHRSSVAAVLCSQKRLGMVERWFEPDASAARRRAWQRDGAAFQRRRQARQAYLAAHPAEARRARRRTVAWCCSRMRSSRCSPSRARAQRRPLCVRYSAAGRGGEDALPHRRWCCLWAGSRLPITAGGGGAAGRGASVGRAAVAVDGSRCSRPR